MEKQDLTKIFVSTIEFLKLMENANLMLASDYPEWEYVLKGELGKLDGVIVMLKKDDQEPEEQARTCPICSNPVNYWESQCYNCIAQDDEDNDEHWLEPARIK